MTNASSAANGNETSPATPLAKSRTSRFSRKLRRASFILPQTGERSKRVFTLREASHRLGGSATETQPLLGGQDQGHEDDSHANHSSEGHNRFWAPDSYPWTFLRAARVRCHEAWQFATSSTGIAIFKCSLAYLLGSLFTLVPVLSALFGHKQDAKHMVATVTVWFHPARSLGSMHEATVLAVLALCYAGVVSFTSMGLAGFFGQHDLLSLGHAIILIVFVGGGLGLVAWVKQRLGHPLVNVASSLASLGCITILIREGSVQLGQFSVDRIVQTLCMVTAGIAIATSVNMLVLPVMARRRLTVDLEKNTDLLGEMLICITRAFLQGRESLIQDDFYKNLNQEHKSSLASMKKNLGEATREQLLLGNERLHAVVTRLVECLSGLSQDLGGLRSAALAQFAFLNEEAAPIPANATTSAYATGLELEQTVQTAPYSTVQSSDTSRRPSYLDIITEAPEDFGELPRNESSLNIIPSMSGSPVSSQLGDLSQSEATMGSLNIKERQESSNAGKEPGNLFLTFIAQLGPPTKSLVYTLKQILDDLPFKKKTDILTQWIPYANDKIEVVSTSQLHTSLLQAIDLYRQSRKDALNVLYQNRAINAAILPRTGGERSAFSAASQPFSRTSSPARSRAPKLPSSPTPATAPSAKPSEAVMADIEEVTACCGHFSFSLLDFAEDILEYLDVLEEMKQEIEHKRRSWNWLLFWRHWRKERSPHLQAMGPVANEGDEQTTTFNIPLDIRRADQFVNPQLAASRRAWYYPVYRAMAVFRRDDTKFAIKVGIGAALYAFPAFFEATRPFFVLWRGEWGLVSYMAVCSMTVGASNTTGFNRFIGTFIGACVAIIGWVMASNHGESNPWLLGLFGWLVALGCFYLILAKDNGPMGRFILLTYNLGALYSYSLSAHDDDNDDDEGGIDPAIWDIVLHRLVAVLVGTIWGIVVCRLIWPSSARRKLRQGLCVLWLRMALIWKRDPLAMFLLGEPASAYMDIREEAELHTVLATLRSLRQAARSEFEFHGPFPDEIVGRLLDAVGRMLDAFHAMNVVISAKLKASSHSAPSVSPGEAAVLRFTRPQRFALSARISHLFTVLASSMKLQYPVADVLPTIDNSRDQLLAKLAAYRRASAVAASRNLEGSSSVREVHLGGGGAAGEGENIEVLPATPEQDYEMLYAYVLVTGQLAQDIARVGEEIEKLYGTLNEENLKFQ